MKTVYPFIPTLSIYCKCAEKLKFSRVHLWTTRCELNCDISSIVFAVDFLKSLYPEQDLIIGFVAFEKCCMDIHFKAVDISDEIPF